MNYLFNDFVDSTFFDKWKIKLEVVCENGCIQYEFLIYFHEKQQLQYLSHQSYSNQEEAISNAYFLCLRAVLDQEKYPALIVAIPSGKILSINLPAFVFFSINAVGLHTIDITLDAKQHEQIYDELRQTGTSHQSIALCDGDGKVIPCQIQAKIDDYYCQWAIFKIFTDSDNLEIIH